MITQSESSRIPLRCLSLVPLLAMLILSASANALDPPYLNEMPPVDRVLREIQGKDALDTVARQNGALEQLMNMIDVMAGKRRFRLTRDEQRIKGTYNAAFSKMERDTLNSFDPAETKRLGMNSQRAKWWSLETCPGRSLGSATQVVSRYYHLFARVIPTTPGSARPERAAIQDVARERD